MNVVKVRFLLENEIILKRRKTDGHDDVIRNSKQGTLVKMIQNASHVN